MKTQKTTLLFLILFITTSFSQQKKDMYLLTETGYQNLTNKTYIHFGIGAEYFLSKKSSLSLRIKYLNTGIEYHKAKISAGFAGFFGSPEKAFSYKGKIITIPFNYKFENRFFFKNIKYFLNTGVALNFTVEDRFLIAKNITPNYNNKTYFNFNLGAGFIYKLNNKIHLSISKEISLLGGAKTQESVGFIFPQKLSPYTSILNIGLRYRLKN
ncbi:outer membrane beta-barrel protein [Tenacibaculum aiptasiae]|uniref:outer membrane beta-barrel protein n=1 Tax=Tenacibaculum aiptasiae TaxID=426481 RepID=UPI0023307E7B|nr:outer membrane beta-barrel protein [Tenacibaculum aiptasiae]